jgi:hypothetical protein
VERTYTGISLIAPSGTVVTIYPFSDRWKAEMDRDRLNARAGASLT